MRAPKTPVSTAHALGAQRRAEALVERLRLLRGRGAGEARPVALRGVGDQRELADASARRRHRARSGRSARRRSRTRAGARPCRRAAPQPSGVVARARRRAGRRARGRSPRATRPPTRTSARDTRCTTALMRAITMTDRCAVEAAEVPSPLPPELRRAESAPAARHDCCSGTVISRWSSSRRRWPRRSPAARGSERSSSSTAGSTGAVVARALAEQHGLEFVDLVRVDVDPCAAGAPAREARAPLRGAPDPLPRRVHRARRRRRPDERARLRRPPARARP